MAEPAKKHTQPSVIEALAALREAMLEEARAAAKEEVVAYLSRGGKQPADEREYLSTKQAATLAGRTVRTIQNWYKDGLPFEKAGNDNRVKRVDLDAYMEQRRMVKE